MSWKNLLLASYWSTSPVIVSTTRFWQWVMIATIIILIGVVLVVLRKKQTEMITRLIMKRWSAFAFTIGLLSLLLLALRQQNAFFLSWRVWYLVVIISLLPWFYKISFYTFRRWPEIRAENAARNLKAKYLPVSKK
jgi:hypothetical protein